MKDLWFLGYFMFWVGVTLAVFATFLYATQASVSLSISFGNLSAIGIGVLFAITGWLIARKQ